MGLPYVVFLTRESGGPRGMYNLKLPKKGCDGKLIFGQLGDMTEAKKKLKKYEMVNPEVLGRGLRLVEANTFESSRVVIVSSLGCKRGLPT